MTIELTKAGYPKEVSVLTGSDMCRGSYYKGIKGCLIGWVNINFPPNKKYNIEDNDDAWGKRTKANEKARKILDKIIIEETSISTYEYLGIEDFSDNESRELGLSLGWLAKLYNTMLYKVGYDISKKDRLDTK